MSIRTKNINQEILYARNKSFHLGVLFAKRAYNFSYLNKFEEGIKDIDIARTKKLCKIDTKFWKEKNRQTFFCFNRMLKTQALNCFVFRTNGVFVYIYDEMSPAQGFRVWKNVRRRKKTFEQPKRLNGRFC